MSKFKKELKDLINKHNKEDGSDTPDHILTKYLIECLKAFDSAVKDRSDWYSFVKSEKGSE